VWKKLAALCAPAGDQGLLLGDEPSKVALDPMYCVGRKAVLKLLGVVALYGLYQS
jgi:hypothetical protein